MTLTLEQAIIITGYTGVLSCPASAFHRDVERRLGRTFFTHEFANSRMLLRNLYRDDFLAMLPEDS